MDAVEQLRAEAQRIMVWGVEWAAAALHYADQGDKDAALACGKAATAYVTLAGCLAKEAQPGAKSLAVLLSFVLSRQLGGPPVSD